MKQLLSYIWPTTKRFSSTINGVLEVTYINGKKVLDTENANYSYGSLQKILEFGLSKVNLKQVDNILLLGMGGGSVIKSLRQKFEYQHNIVAVEIDSEIVKLAKEEFNISTSPKLQIIEADAYAFTKNCKDKFQLIVIDLFIDLEVPDVFFKRDFCENIAKMLVKNGWVIFNVGVNIKSENNTVDTLKANFGNSFQFQVHKKVNGTNTLLIAEKV